MLKRTGPLAIICIAVLLLMPAVVKAADEGLEYTVQKGDTLWDISSGKLSDPLLWPKLWKANPHIHNPHLIFPNEKVVIPAELLKDRTGPRVKLDTKRKLITPESLASRIVPGVSKRPIVDREVLLQSGYFARSVDRIGKIENTPLAKTLLGNGDTVYVSTAVKVNPDEKFYIVTQPEAIFDPLQKGRVAGYHVKIKGIASITEYENGKTKAVITEAYKEINLGDLLIGYYPISLPIEPSILRRPQISGVVLGIWNKQTEGGKQDVVYLSAGTAQGVEIGDIFTVTSRTAPNPLVGTVQVFSISDAGSAAIIKQAMSEIKIGDTIGN